MSEMVTRHNGSAIRDYRVLKGWKKTELATAARCQYSHVDNLEHERKEASVELLHRIANALGISVQSIVRHPTYALSDPAARRPA